MTTLPGNDFLATSEKPKQKKQAEPTVKKPVDYKALEKLRFNDYMSDGDLFMIEDIEEAHKVVKGWMDKQIGDNMDDDRARGMIEASLPRIAKYMFCKGVFNTASDKYSLRIDKKEDGAELKAYSIQFTQGSERATRLSRTHNAQSKSAYYGILNLEMMTKVDEDNSMGLPIMNLAVKFASLSERKVPHDFLTMFLKKPKEGYKEFVESCKDKKFHDVYASASMVDKKLLTRVMRRVLVEDVLNHRDYTPLGYTSRTGAFWLEPPYAPEYARIQYLEAELEHARSGLAQKEGSIQ